MNLIIIKLSYKIKFFFKFEYKSLTKSKKIIC